MGLGKNRIKRLATKKSGKRKVEGSLLEWALKIFYTPVKAQRVSTVEAAFSNQFNKMTYSLGVNQALSPATHCLFNRPRNAVAIVAKMKNHGLNANATAG